MTKGQGWLMIVILTLIASAVAESIGQKVICGILYAVAWIGLWWHILDEWEKRRA